MHVGGGLGNARGGGEHSCHTGQGPESGSSATKSEVRSGGQEVPGLLLGVTSEVMILVRRGG